MCVIQKQFDLFLLSQTKRKSLKNGFAFSNSKIPKIRPNFLILSKYVI